MKCSASVETARYSPRSRRLGRPKTRPISAPTAADAGSVTQNGAPNSLNRMPGGEGARGEQAGVPERDLAGVAGEQHQRHCADRRQQHLVGEVERERAGEKRIARPAASAEDRQPDLLRARVEQRLVALVAGAEVSAGPRLRSYAVQFLARAEQAPGPHHQHRQQHEERHHVREQRIDVVDQQHLGAGDDQASRPARPAGCPARRPAPPERPSGRS